MYVAVTRRTVVRHPQRLLEGHLGGFVVGAAVAWIYLQLSKRKHRNKQAA